MEFWNEIRTLAQFETRDRRPILIMTLSLLDWVFPVIGYAYSQA